MHDDSSPPWIVVIAASSGGMRALIALVSRLPADLPAAVLIASHTPSTSHRGLPRLLSMAGPLPASHPEEGQTLEAGRIFVAPPDRHLVVEGRRVQLTVEEKEHGMRPAADVLFRSAAREFGARCVGVVLSGSGRDGSTGLAAVQAAGGRALIQAPDDAKLATMPLNALAELVPDACAPAAELGPLVADFACERGLTGRGTARGMAPGGGRRERARSLTGLRILVVEDDYLIASEIMGMLRGLGCLAVGPVSDVDRGLSLLARMEAPPDCAVLDVDLRGESVLPLASELGRRRIPLVFATGYGKAILPEEWEGAPRLQKPYDASALGSALGRALHLRWLPPSAPPAAASDSESQDIHSQQEALKDSRNLLMQSYALRTSSSNKFLTQSYEALRSTQDCLARSALRTESARRVLRRAASGEDDENDGVGR